MTESTFRLIIEILLALLAWLLICIVHDIYSYAQQNEKRKINNYAISILYIILITYSANILYIKITDLDEIFNRRREINKLQEYARFQKDYYDKNGRYANSFDELKYDKHKYSERFTIYLRQDKLYWNISYKLPSFINLNENMIYAIDCYSDTNDCDVFASDYSGDVTTILSKKEWLLPLPKWHEWK
jgi:hypothetical protein